MQALVLKESLSASDLELIDAPAPEPGPGQMRVRVTACGLNPVDYKVAGDGRPGDIPGIDIAGTVDALGAGVSDNHRLRPGDRVAGHLDVTHGGGLAEYCLAPADVLAPVPDALSDVAAAALPCAGMTAYQSVDRRLRVGSGDTVLVTAAAGGMGGMAVQVAALRGSRVIGTASARNHELVKTLGADAMIDYHDGDVAQQTLELTDGRGVDAIVECVGTATELLPVLAFGGGLAAIAQRPDWDAVAPFTTAPSVHEIALGAAHQHGDQRARDELQTMLTELLELVAAGKLDPRVTATFDLADVPGAYAELMAGHVVGKYVAQIG